MDVRNQLLRSHFCFEVPWGSAAWELVRLGRILHDWRDACRIHGQDDEVCLQKLRESINPSEADLEALRSVDLLEHSRHLGVAGFFSAANSDPVLLASSEDGGDAEALARLLSFVMWKHTRETGNRLLFTFSGCHQPDEDEDRNPQGGVIVVTPSGYRIQTLSHLMAKLGESDFWPKPFLEASFEIPPAATYLLPEEMRHANRLPRRAPEAMTHRSGPSL